MSTLKRRERSRYNIRRIVIAAIVSAVLCFSLVGGISAGLLHSGDPIGSRSREVNPPAPLPASSPTLVKEYIYAGGKLIATEEPVVNAAPIVSIASPANNTVFTAPASITIEATASDSDGSISKVEFYQGTTLLSTDTAAPFSFNWSNVAAGAYSLIAKATDINNAETTSSTITVISNAAPTVSIATPANNAVFTAPANITLNATASDSDGAISKVEFYQGATLLSVDTTAPFSFNWSNVAAGTYSLTARATDNNNTVTTSSAISVISNGAPTLSIETPANNAVFTAPANITINATASDSDGTISKVEFYQGTTLLISDTAAPFSFAWNNVPAGTYSLTAKATDNSNAVTTSGAVTVISNAAPTVSITTPANNAVFTAPASITINATASDSDGTISKVEFYQGTALLSTDTAAPFSLNWSNVAAGTYSLTARATDNNNAVMTSSAVTVISNAAPTVSIATPANNAVFTAPANITLNATASDSDGAISKVEFFQGTTLLSTDTAAPFSFAWNNVSAGTYSLTAKVTDNNNAATTSSAVTVTSNAAPTVSITSPANNSVFTAPASITLNATANDSDGNISKVEFYQGTTLLNTDTATPFSFNWSNVAAGTYSLTARATDNNNTVTTSTPINVLVNPGCTPPVGLIISEFRLRGPNGSHDEYIELYNNTDAGIKICTADGSSGWALVSSDGISRFVVASGTVIPGRAHYLAVAGGYSLTGYSGSTPGNLTYATDIPENSGLALFNTANASNFTLANRFDAVGFTSSDSLYREGAGFALLGANTGQYCFFRKLDLGTPGDSGDNVADFRFLATDGGVYGSLVAILGGPGPENLASPIQRNASLPITMLDPMVAINVAPNRLRDTTAIGPNAAAGTLSIRRTITNNTGANVTRLRFRVTSITTLNSPGYLPGGSQADMRVLSSTDFTATITGGQQVLVRGTTLETPPAQGMGGGLHSSLAVGVISLSQPLAPSQTISVQFLLGVQQSGSFNFFVNVEALP